MAGRLAAVPEASTTAAGFTAPYPPPRNLYRESIRRLVVVSGGYIRSTLSSQSHSQSGHSGSSYSYSSDSSASNPCPSSNSGGGGSEADFFGPNELTRIASRMVSDGYARSMVRAFDDAVVDGPGRALESWLFELDVDWVLQIPGGYLQRQLQLQHRPAPWLQDLAERWIRALVVIAFTVRELLLAAQPETPAPAAVARFGEASVSAMLVFVDAAVPLLMTEKLLRAVLHMYTCVRGSRSMFTVLVVSPDAQGIFRGTGGSLEKEENRLHEAISSTVEDDALWAAGISRGRGEVHMITRFMADCMLSVRRAGDTGRLLDMIQPTLGYLKDLLLRKSKLLPDPSLRYLFLLNNNYFVEQLFGPYDSSGHHKFMDSYLDVSWGRVLSCIPKSNVPGPFDRWIGTSPLAKFQSAFHRTYKAQKFWKVPDPWLRDALRKTVIERVIAGYRDYLKEHPELEKQVRGGSSSPDVLEEMLGELFEG